jgi:hypothetical protein
MMADQYRIPTEVSGSFNKLIDRTKKQEEPLDPEYMDQYKKAMLAADREMENPQLMAEYWANQRYLDKELGNTRPAPIDTIRSISKQNRAPISTSFPAGGQSPMGNMSKEVDAPMNDGIRYGMNDVEGNALEAGYNAQKGTSERSQPTDGTNALSKAALTTMLAGGAGAAGYTAGKAYGFPDFIGSSADRMAPESLIKMNHQTPNVNIPKNRLGVTPINKPSFNPTRTLETPSTLDNSIDYTRKEMSPISKYGNNPASKFNVGPGGVTESGEFANFKGFPKAVNKFVPEIAQDAMGALKRFSAPVLSGLSHGVSPELPQEHLDAFKQDTMAKLEEQKDAMLLAKHTKMTYDEALNKIRAERNL